jgi:hypothetical protein
MTAGVASAEITFSGTGEAGFYRTGKVKAVAAVAGRDTDYVGDVDSAGANVAAITAGTTSDKVGYNAAGELTVVKGTGTVAEATEDSAARTAVPTADSAASAADLVRVAEETLRTKERDLQKLGADKTKAEVDAAVDAVAVAKANLAARKAAYANLAGTAAVAAVNAGDLKAYSGYDFEVGASMTGDNGLTVALGFDMGAGSIADQDDDRALDEQAEEIATSAVTIGYNGYTLAIGDDKIDDLYDDSQNGDVSLGGSFGDLAFTIVTDMDKDIEAKAATFTKASGDAGAAAYKNATFTDAVAAVYNTTSYAVTYAMGDMSFAMSGTDHDDFGNAAAKYSLTYKLLPSLSATLESDNLGTYKDIAKLSATYTVSDAMSITASVKDDKAHALNTNTGGKQSQDMSIAYSAGSLSATIASDESSNWWVNAKYDLGGGATAFTTFDHTEFLVAGVNFAF